MLALVAGGFLSQDWRDVIEVIALIGVAATLIALIIAFFQIRRTTKSAEAARKAADSTRTDVAENLWLADLTSATRRISEIRSLFRSEQFQNAGLRLDDLRELLVQVGASRPPAPGTDDDFGRAIKRVSSLQKALDTHEEDQSILFDRVRANRWLLEVSDVLIKFATEARMQTGGTDGHS